MKTIVDINDRHAVVTVVGRIDTITSIELRKDLTAVDYAAIDALDMDFTDVSYISSAGLRELLTLKKRLGKKPFHIFNVSHDVANVFEVTGFSFILEYSLSGKTEDYSLMSFKEFYAYKYRTAPDKFILKEAGLSYTWEDIEVSSQIAAADLAGLGVGKGTHVGICGFNSVNWIIVFCAIQKLGAIACLVNFNLCADEVIKVASFGDITHLCCGEMMQLTDDAEVQALTASEGCPISKIYDIRKSVRFMDRYDEYANIRGLYEGKVEADDACVMVFTSGSTGVPKGVLLSAYNILNSACSNVNSLHLTDKDTACLMLPLFHIFGLVAGLVANQISNTMIVLPDDVRTATLLRTIEEERCTIFHSVPTMLLAIVNNKDFDSSRVASLRSTILSGSLANPSQVEMLMKYFPNNHFASSYGMSEMAPVSITDYDDPAERIMNTIGKPIEGIDIRIYDNENKCECIAGEAGEIQVQGFNLMSCYYKADLDLQSIDEDGWLHTGDIGFLDDDGYLHFAGRIKDIIVRAGENIYPAEVSEVIASEDGIANVVVAGVPDNFWGENVAAALVLEEGAAFDEDEFRTRLSSKLAKFKIPRYFCIYDAFPMLPNGKVDMVALRRDLENKTKSE